MLTHCFGFRLNTAGIVIGWAGSVFSFIGIVLLSLTFNYLDEISKAIIDHINDPSITQASVQQFLIIGISVYLAINVINLCASALLITGTVKERHLLLVPWLLNAGLALLVQGINLTYLLIVAVSTNAPFSSSAISLISIGINLAINFFIWYVVYSLYKQIQANRDAQQRLLPATSSSSYPSYTKI